jgi:hypothetical protein
MAFVLTAFMPPLIRVRTIVTPCPCLLVDENGHVVRALLTLQQTLLDG